MSRVLTKSFKFAIVFVAVLVCSFFQSVHAAGPPAPSLFDSPLAIALLLVMILLLIVIGVLAYILIGAADLKLKDRKKAPVAVKLPLLLMVFLLAATTPSMAQDEVATATVTASKQIGDMDASVFYLMNAVIFLEFLIVLGLLYNIRVLIRKEKLKQSYEGMTPETVKEIKRNRLTWWDRMNKLKPVSEEATLVLDHEYDGIKELNNGLPPWWLYGFYLTIIFAVVYLWRFHVSHTAPSSIEEYTQSVTRAELKIQEYLKTKGDAVDENTVAMMTDAADLDAGKLIFEASCASCHKSDGGGQVGPNLTDNYWMHGGDIKSVFRTIRYGINAMPQWQNSYSNKEIAQVASYVKSLHGSNPPGAKAPQGNEEKEVAAVSDSSAVAKPDSVVSH